MISQPTDECEVFSWWSIFPYMIANDSRDKRNSLVNVQMRKKAFLERAWSCLCQIRLLRLFHGMNES